MRSLSQLRSCYWPRNHQHRPNFSLLAASLCLAHTVAAHTTGLRPSMDAKLFIRSWATKCSAAQPLISRFDLYHVLAMLNLGSSQPPFPPTLTNSCYHQGFPHSSVPSILGFHTKPSKNYTQQPSLNTSLFGFLYLTDRKSVV